jgi:hypothetical protein
MKGIIFAGCSFTWGQGLYFYSDLPDVPRMGDVSFEQHLLKDSHIKFKDTLKFPRIVANHFNTFESVRKQNGGSDDDSILFVNDLFNPLIENNNFKHNDFDYLIFQTSQIVRNKFKFDYGGKTYNINVPGKHHTYTENEMMFLNWLTDSGITYDQWYESFKIQVINKIKKFLLSIEEKGIKTKILLWQDDLINLVEEDEFLSERFVILEDESKTYKCIDYLIKMNKGMTIGTDYENLINPVHDTHPSKKCHEIIAKSLIKNIENNKL